MRNVRNLFVALSLSACAMAPAQAQVSVNIGLPGANIGINMPVFPELVQVPGYPVYYDPQASSNYFFYDGSYWVYSGDDWYSSSWYNGPWQPVGREYVPLFVLRVPVRYYRRPPSYFRGWRGDAAPRWGDHWGRDWAQRRRGWDRWDRRSAPAAAPLPVYQRQYSGDRYPRVVEQQRSIQSQNYRYQPREAVTGQRVAPVRDERREPERREAAPLPQQRHQVAMPPQERRQSALPPQERYQRAQPPQERHQAAPPPQERYQAAPPPPERHQRTAQPPQERHQAAPSVQERHQTGPPPQQNRGHKPQKQNKGQEKKEERGDQRH